MRHAARGVDLIQEITPLGDPNGPLIVTVVETDPSVPGVRIEAALGQDRVWGDDPTFGREVVPKLVTRHKAVAGVNAGFFPFAGNPIGLHIENGDLVTEPYGKRWSFYITNDGKTGFARFTFTGTVRAAKDTTTPPHTIDALNRNPDLPKTEPNDLLLFTPIFFSHTLPKPVRFEVVLQGVPSPLQPNREYTGTVAYVGEGGNTPIAPNTVVISGGGAGADFLKASAQPGAQMVFRIGVTPVDAEGPDPTTLREVVTGGSELLANGKNVALLKREGAGAPMSTIPNPRTAVGRTADGKILLVTVDGRQKGLSKGARLPSLAEILLRFGATDAINLDGGGSSTEAVWDAVANSPSEALRPIADALLVYADDLPPPSALLPRSLHVPGRPLNVGETWDFSVPALNENDNAVWGLTGNEGFLSQTGVFQARRAGKGMVEVTMGSRLRSLHIPITVVGKNLGDVGGFIAKLTLTPDPAHAPLGALLTIHIANAEGDSLAGEPISIQVTGGTANPPTVTTNGRGDAQTSIIWDGTTVTRSIVVTSPQKRFATATLTP